MENIVIFILSIFINLSEFDKYRLNSYFSKNNYSFSEFIDNKNLYFTSFNYKINNDQNYIERITLPLDSFKKIKEIRFLTYKYFRTNEIVENLDVICSFTTCNFILKELQVKNLNIEIISERNFKNNFTIIFNKNPVKKFNPVYKPDFKINNLKDNISTNISIKRYNLNDFISEIKSQKNFDPVYLTLIEQKIINYETNKIEVDRFLADYINKKKYRTAYIAYKDEKFFLTSKIYYNEPLLTQVSKINFNKPILLIQDFFFIKEYYLRNSNLSFNFSFLSNFKLTYDFNNFYYKVIFYITMIIFTLKILFIKISKNSFIKYKFYFIIFYFLLIDSIIFNLFSIFFIFYFFLLNKKYLKNV